MNQINKTKKELDVPRHILEKFFDEVELSFKDPKIRADFEKWKKEREKKTKEK